MTDRRSKDFIIIGMAATAAVAVAAVFWVFQSGYGQSAIAVMYDVENATDSELLIHDEMLPRDFNGESYAPANGWQDNELELYSAGQVRSVTLSSNAPPEPRRDRFAITALAPDNRSVVFQKIYTFEDLEENGAKVTLEE